MREDEVAIYQYGYYLLFEIALNLSLGLICGILLHAVNKVFLFWIIYIPLRKYCGGWHASRDWVCTIISTIVCYGNPLVSDIILFASHCENRQLIILRSMCDWRYMVGSR